MKVSLLTRLQRKTPKDLDSFEKGTDSKLVIGWQEWCALPKLHLPAIKAKIDTGATTSALHASNIRPFHRHGELFVHFDVQPFPHNPNIVRTCTAPVIDERQVMNSSGAKEQRYVIQTPLVLGSHVWTIDISLTNRELLSFRMLLGRNALKKHTLISPGKILCQGKLTARHLALLYQT